MQSDWQYRDQATATDDELDTRMLQVRAATVDEEERSVEAILSTDTPVRVFDWREYEEIDEILLTDSVELPRQMPLLAVHSRYSLNDVLGSVRSIREETADGHSQLVGRLHFAENDEAAERAWQKVRQGHITDVSVGYRVIKAVDIAKGDTATINGREFTATERRLRVATEWAIREASIVPIGADQKAKTRAKQRRGEKAMNKELREYLESIGLRAEATDEEAYRFLAELEGDQRTRAQQVMLGVEPQRNEPEGEDGNEGRQNEGNESGEGRDDDDPVTAERQRCVAIRELAGSDVPATIVDQAIREGWDMSRASQEFLGAVRGQRMRQEGQAPAGQSRSREAQVSARSLAAGMLATNGIDPVGVRMHDGLDVMRREEIAERDADAGDEFRGMSAVDLVRECARLDTGRLYRSPEEAFRAAVSGTSLNRVFTTNMYAQLIAGWDEVADTTAWCQVEEVPNFMTQEDITLRAQANLDRHGRGGTAKHATMEDDYETYKVARYSKQFVVDEQDVIDDRLGAIMIMPFEMGQAARRLRPNLVYSILLANAALTATGGALFNSTAETTSGGHANLGSTALGSAGLKAAINGMGSHRLEPNNKKDKVPLNIQPAFLIVPPDLKWTAKELLTAGEVRDTTASTKYPTINVLQSENLSLIVESRIDATGCTDPETGTAYTGSATNYFLAAARRTVKVAYRRGTNRSPQMRSFALTQGQWGIGWDINMDIGAAAVDFRGLYQGNS